ncbi:ABC transporter permease [Uliginosibacterium gangwonense]|uniref:ABC transporter permease n=1 Tax=Uliginosibacterium gangwonense TaxID=392736 RepID=UPI0003A4D5B8|nr:ABC transporter permease [Uliginosibacterium gangwonense]
MSSLTATILTEMHTENSASLKDQLRRAERMKKLRYGALILPLALFLLLTFVWPIAALLKRSVDNPEIVGAFPVTSSLLHNWNGKALPDEATFVAFADELGKTKGTPPLAAAAKRLNMEQPGFRSVMMHSARAMPPETGTSPKDALIAADSRWGEIATWQFLARNASPYTARYLLASVDRKYDEQGNIVAADEDEAIYVDVLVRTFEMSFVVTVCCLLLGFPLAYMMASQPPKIANVIMIFVLLPFWTSILVRVAAWIVLLQSQGLVNQALMAMGIIHEPLQLVFNRVGVYIAMVHILLPFMILPLYSVMKGISPTYVRAAQSLGCPPLRSFWKVYFPQALPGVGAGGLLVFILCMGYYITPALLGSPKEQMASYFVAFYTNQTINWGMAAALSAILFVATLVLYMVYSKLVGSPDVASKAR